MLGQRRTRQEQPFGSPYCFQNVENSWSQKYLPCSMWKLEPDGIGTGRGVPVSRTVEGEERGAKAFALSLMRCDLHLRQNTRHRMYRCEFR